MVNFPQICVRVQILIFEILSFTFSSYGVLTEELWVKSAVFA